MKIFGIEITRVREKALNSVTTSERGGWMRVMESFSGAWQRNIVVDRQSVLAHHAVFSCTTLIASDIAKLRVKLTTLTNGVWEETKNPAFSPVLRKPNGYQNRIQFWENWILSKLNHGNTYVLKQRDGRNAVAAMYVLDPRLVLPLIADNGDVYYQLNPDKLADIHESIIVPASEIIHDRMNCLFHPLVGIPPIYANGLAATQGLNIQKASIRLFANNSNPGGILTAPGNIDDPTAARVKAQWEQNFSGDNQGRVAVLGSGLKYEKMAMTAVESQVIDQLKMTAQIVCSTYHVPPYKVGLEAPPAYNNIQALQVEYYSQCLQILIESAELCLDEGLGLGEDVGVEFDIDNLLRMDSASLFTTLGEGVKGTILAPNEARKRVNLKAVPGGDSPMAQQQNFSLAALAKRDASDNPFAFAPKPDRTVVPDAENPPAGAAAAAPAKGGKSVSIRTTMARWAGSYVSKEAA